MSLIGNRIAVVSLGSSCQTAHQLKLNAALVSELCGDELKHVRLPFDWVIGPIEKTTEWLRPGTIFPNSPNDLTVVSRELGTFFWEQKGIYFWHDFRSANYIDVDHFENFERTRAVYAKSFDAFRQILRKKRIVFIISNTQNNLLWAFGDDYWKIGFDFNEENIRNIKHAVNDLFGVECELICVTYAKRSADTLSDMKDMNIFVERVEPDNSGWQGDDDAWKNLIANYFKS